MKQEIINIICQAIENQHRPTGEYADKILALLGVSISLERAKKYARHQHFLGTQGKDLVEFEDWQAKD